VSSLSGGSGKGNITYTSQKWQIAANAMYQLPAGFEIAASFFGRQGTARPFFAGIATNEGTKNTLVDPTADTHRLANIFDLDLRLAKNIKFGSVTLTASAELFNVMNSNTELNRINNVASSSTFNRLDEIMAPRIARFGLRLAF
jgi:hypothetical protein